MENEPEKNLKILKKTIAKKHIMMQYSVIICFLLKLLSRVDERTGSMTPQQPIELGANTDKVTECTLNDDF